jgi:hypothetical protein
MEHAVEEQIPLHLDGGSYLVPRKVLHEILEHDETAVAIADLLAQGRITGMTPDERRDALAARDTKPVELVRYDRHGSKGWTQESYMVDPAISGYLIDAYQKDGASDAFMALEEDMLASEVRAQRAVAVVETPEERHVRIVAETKANPQRLVPTDRARIDPVRVEVTREQYEEGRTREPGWVARNWQELKADWSHYRKDGVWNSLKSDYAEIKTWVAAKWTAIRPTPRYIKREQARGYKAGVEAAKEQVKKAAYDAGFANGVAHEHKQGVAIVERNSGGPVVEHAPNSETVSIRIPGKNERLPATAAIGKSEAPDGRARITVNSQQYDVTQDLADVWLRVGKVKGIGRDLQMAVFNAGLQAGAATPTKAKSQVEPGNAHGEQPVAQATGVAPQQQPTADNQQKPNKGRQQSQGMGL